MVEDTVTHQFLEDGELVQMEINDGGTAEHEFVSEPNTESGSEDDSDQSMEDIEDSQQSKSNISTAVTDNHSDGESESEEGRNSTQRQLPSQVDLEACFEDSE